MTELANEFLSHVLARAEELCRENEDCAVTSDGERVTITTPAQVAHVNFYELSLVGEYVLCLDALRRTV